MSVVSSLTDRTNTAPQEEPSLGSSDFQMTSSLESYFEAPEEEPSLESLGEKQEETRDPKVLAQQEK